MRIIGAASKDDARKVSETPETVRGRWPAKTNPPTNIHGLGRTCQSSAGNKNEVFVEKNKLKTTCALCNREIEIRPEQFFLFFCCTRCGCDFWPPDGELRRLYRNYKGEVAKLSRLRAEALPEPTKHSRPENVIGTAHESIKRFCRDCKDGHWSGVRDCPNTACWLWPHRRKLASPKGKLPPLRKLSKKQLEGLAKAREASPISKKWGLDCKNQASVHGCQREERPKTPQTGIDTPVLEK